jgi:hypothetical protein
MSHYHNIFVKTQESAESVADTLERVLNVPKTLVNDDEILYEFSSKDFGFSLGTHNLENDRNLRFEEYRYQVEVYTNNIRLGVERRGKNYKVAHTIFEKLKSRGSIDQCWLMIYKRN